MTLVAGVDSSTQSCKVVVCDAETGQVVRQARPTQTRLRWIRSIGGRRGRRPVPGCSTTFVPWA